jgi:hypothetical protein
MRNFFKKPLRGDDDEEEPTGGGGTGRPKEPQP